METRKKYGELFTKPDIWTEEEEKSIHEFESFIRHAKEYSPYINETTEEIISNYDHEIEFLQSLHPDALNENMKRTIKKGQELKNIISFEEQKQRKEEQERQKEERLQLKLQKRAGYTNASILIFVICNLGLFLATILLMLK